MSRVEGGEGELQPALPPRLPDDAHKGTAGRVTCIVGSTEMPGAAILVARAAQRAGAGLVTVGCLDATGLGVVPGAVPEAVLTDLGPAFEPAEKGAAEGGGEPTLSARADELLLARDPHAALIGPGIGDDARARVLVRRLCTIGDGVPRVVDADGLNALRGEPELLADSVGPVILTPHPGEAGRLLGRAIPPDRDGRTRAAEKLARRSGAIVCLKGSGTVVTDGERTFVNTTGNPGLATAGSGDVLAGILVAYLARVRSAPERSWNPLRAAVSAVHVHGLAGDVAAEELGPDGVIASDLIGFLPEAGRRLTRAGD